jgi:hypothetical protein
MYSRIISSLLPYKKVAAVVSWWLLGARSPKAQYVFLTLHKIERSLGLTNYLENPGEVSRRFCSQERYDDSATVAIEQSIPNTFDIL